MADIYSGMKGIPIDILVSQPLMAAARANLALAQSLQEFVYAMAFKGGDPNAGTALLSFTLERPYQSPADGTWTSQTITVNAPLIAVVPIPSLLVDNVTIDFTTEIKSFEKTEVGVNSEVSAMFGFGAWGASAMVATTVNNTRSTDQTAKYTFHVQANQQQPTEGMSKLVDIFASCIEPLPQGGGGGGGGSSSSSSSS